MPFIEAWTPAPEWPSNYRDCCVITTLESMFGQILGQRSFAPESVYRLCQYQSDRPTIKEAGMDDLQKLTWGLACAKKNILAVISAWVDADMEMRDYLAALDLRFVNSPYRELEKLATSGSAVGVTYVNSRPNGPGHTGHMFHLHRHGLALSPNDVSSRSEVKKKVRNFIRTGKIIQLVEETRRAGGYSALVISPWC